MSWNNRTVLVTGAEGFIGSTLVDLLVEQGARVRALVHYKPYAEKGYLAHLLDHPAVEMIAGDVRDAGRVSDAVAGCDTVFHLAALIGIPYSYDSPGAYVQTNVVGTENIARPAAGTRCGGLCTPRRVRCTGRRGRCRSRRTTCSSRSRRTPRRR